MFNSPLLLTVFNGVGRLVNFALYLIIANLYGASQSTDWFFFVYAVAYFFIGICYYATESALVPAWHQLPEEEHPQMFRLAVRLAFYALPVIGFLLFVSGFFIAPRQGIVPPNSMAMVLVICVVLALQPSLAFLSSFFSSYRQFNRQYTLPTVHLTLRTVGVLVILFLVPYRTIMILAVAYLAGELFRLIFLQSGQLRKKKPCESPAFSKNSFWLVYGHVVWMTVALMCTVINPVIDLAMVGKFRGGSVTLVEYAGRLRGMPVLALGGLLVYFLGEWSHQHHQQGKLLAWKQVNNSFVKLILFCFPVVVLLMISEKLWVPLVFFSKKFAVEDLQQLQQLLYWYFPGVVFLAGSLILSRAILVVQQAKLMAFITLIAAGLNVVCNLVFLEMMGLAGVALSTTLVDTFVCVMYYLVVRQLFNHSLFPDSGDRAGSSVKHN
jgi:putative peptidoglycan lipid II flippase